MNQINKHVTARRTEQLAFSLVELSIVLVILGLLIGGVLSGQSLIRAAELRAVSSEYARYTTAVQSFRDKYFALPGDMNNATAFWGRQNGNADCVTNSGATPVATGVCDGNANGISDGAAAASQAGEFAQFWRQLANAGLIEGTYTGLAGSGSTVHCVLGTDCPRSKLSNAGWGLRGFSSYFAGNGSDFAGDYGNVFEFGGQTTSYPFAPVLRPEEAWNIDTKIDDGKPGAGKMVAYAWTDCAMAASATDFAANYNLSNTSVVCRLHFMRAF